MILDCKQVDKEKCKRCEEHFTDDGIHICGFFGIWCDDVELNECPYQTPTLDY